MIPSSHPLSIPLFSLLSLLQLIPLFLYHLFCNAVLLCLYTSILHLFLSNPISFLSVVSSSSHPSFSIISSVMQFYSVYTPLSFICSCPIPSLFSLLSLLHLIPLFLSSLLLCSFTLFIHLYPSSVLVQSHLFSSLLSLLQLIPLFLSSLL